MTPACLFPFAYVCCRRLTHTSTHIAGTSSLVARTYVVNCHIILSHPANVEADALTLSKLNIVCHPILAPCGVIFQFHICHVSACSMNNALPHFLFFFFCKMNFSLIFLFFTKWQYCSARRAVSGNSKKKTEKRRYSESSFILDICTNIECIVVWLIRRWRPHTPVCEVELYEIEWNTYNYNWKCRKKCVGSLYNIEYLLDSSLHECIELHPTRYTPSSIWMWC